jgi:hypothetical protein
MNRLRCNRSFVAVAAIVLTLAPFARALDPNEWQHRQTLAIDRTGVVKIALPPATLDLGRPNLEDLRLLDASGRETPFLVERAAPIVAPSRRAPRAFRVSLRDAATELFIDCGARVPLDAVALATPAPALLKGARVEISDDGNAWQTVLSGAPLFRQFGAEQLTVDLGGRTAAQVRITIDDTRSRPIPFTGATLALAAATPRAVTAPLPVKIVRREEFAGETVFTLDVGGKHVPLARLEFVTGEPLFARQVTIATSELRDDTAVERVLASGPIYRISVDGLPPQARLEVPADFTAPAREVLVHVRNGDSPLLAIDEIRAQQRPVWLVFRAEPGTYRLLTGNPDIASPAYDLATFASSLRDVAASAAVPGPPELNPGYRRSDTLAATPLLGAALDPAPWKFRKPVRLATSGVQQLELDVDVLAQAQPGLSDLRLVRRASQVPYLVERPALSRSINLAAAPANDPRRPGLSRWQLSLPRAAAPVNRLVLTSPTVLFQRHLRLFEIVEGERGGATYERTLAEADWSRAPGTAAAACPLPLLAPPTSNTLLLETDNGDNPPLELATVRAVYPVVRLLFKTDYAAAAPETDRLALYYGNREVAAPRYDLALVAGQILAAEKNVATLGPEERPRAEGWVSTALQGARGGIAFWVGLALVVVVLLVVVARLLPKPPS